MLTPKTLRELFRHCWEEGEPWYKEGMAAADAWEEDLKRLASAGQLIEDYFVCEDTTVLCEAQAILKGEAQP